MSQHPGFFAIAFVCLGLAGFALWPSPAQYGNAPVNIYLGNPDMNAGPDGETALEEELNDGERSDSALPDESAIFAI